MSSLNDGSFLSKFNKPELIEKITSDAKHGILINDKTIFNPLENIPEIAKDKVGEYYSWLMSDPDYFYFIMKAIFQMKSWPAQCVILKELYTHRFPILIASRGYGKCVHPDSMVVTNTGIKTIKELVPDDIEFKEQECSGQAYGETGYRDIEYSFYNGEKPTKKITARSGRDLEGVLEHPIRVVRNDNIEWVNMEDLQECDYTVVDRSVEEWESNGLNSDVAYMIGAIVGDGCYATKSSTLEFTNQDQECLLAVNHGLQKYFQRQFEKVNDLDTSYDYRVKRGIDVKRKFVKDFQCNEYDYKTDKITPKKIFGASFKSISSYLQGLFDTDGTCSKHIPIVSFTSKSKQLVSETQFLLLCLGIVSYLRPKYNKKYKRYYYDLVISGGNLRIFKDKIGFRISRKQDILKIHCLKDVNENIDLLPRSLVVNRLLKLRKLATDIKISHTHSYSYDRQLVSPYRIKKYGISHSTLQKMLNVLGRSPSVQKSKDYRFLLDILDKNYFYDEIVEIKNSFSKTYDIHIDDDDHSFITNGFISHNTTVLGIYLLISMMTRPGVKCIITGAGFRQAKLVFDVMEQIWVKSPVFQNCYKGRRNGPSHGTDVWSFRLDDSICYAIPTGHDGSKVRGYRANILVVDEFATIIRNVFEEVMSGFLAVASSPMEQIERAAIKRTLQMFKIPIDSVDDTGILDNQLILSGTAFYKHNHFYHYFNQWRDIIHNHDKPDKLKEIVGEDYDEKFFKPSSYCTIRIPIELATEGFMDLEQINRIKSSTSQDVYKREYGAVFSDDSDGFYKMSLLEAATSCENFKSPSGDDIPVFAPMIYGDPRKRYVYGIDPAYKGDNFAIVILECDDNYRKIVYCWTTQSSDHKQRLKDGVITENDYYHYCVRKIRELMARFPCEAIALDVHGGGTSLKEAFTDKTKLLPGENLIFPRTDLTKAPADTDSMAGDHIIHLITSQSEWIVEANNMMKMDFEDKKLLFPYNDNISGAIAEFYDNKLGEHSSLYDTLEDCITEIMDLKIEVTTIVVSETATGRQRFDTPDIKTAAHKKGRLKKDRYSALLMANWVARTLHSDQNRRVNPNTFNLHGIDMAQRRNLGEPSFVGNLDVCNKLNSLYKNK